MKCPKCGTSIGVSSPYCPKCGVELRSYDPSTNPWICGKCHFTNAPGTVFCSRCGTKLAAPDDSGMIDITNLGNEPYLRYKGFPFATLSEVTQTYAQFRTSAILTAVFFGFIVSLLVVAGELFAAFAIAGLITVAFVFLWWVGRTGVEGVSSEDLLSDEFDGVDSPKDRLKIRRM